MTHVTALDIQTMILDGVDVGLIMEKVDQALIQAFSDGFDQAMTQAQEEMWDLRVGRDIRSDA
jgi:hypothetical protein